MTKPGAFSRILSTISEGFHELQVLRDSEKEEAFRNQLDADFRENVALADVMGDEMNHYCGVALAEQRKSHEPVREGCEVFFCGCIQADQSERALLSNPLAFQGGLLMRTSMGNILLDCGSGTLRGLYESSYSIRDVDLVLITHAHPSATNELDAVMNGISGFTPGRTEKEEPPPAERKVYLLSTQCTIEGRDGHPAVYREPTHKLALKRDPFVAKKNGCWVLKKRNGKVTMEDFTDKPDAVPSTSCLLIEALPARHKEAPRKKRGFTLLRDDAGESEDAVFCYRISNPAQKWSVIYTGDTEMDQEKLSWIADKKYRHPSLLVANTRSLAYVPQHKKLKPVRASNGGGLSEIHATKNQLGWWGTTEMTKALQPEALVMRAFHLECVIRKRDDMYVYAPDRLAVYHRKMEQELHDAGLKTRVHIPGRTLIKIEEGGAVSVKEEYPCFFPYGSRIVADSFVTTNQALAGQINLHVRRLEEARLSNEAVHRSTVSLHTEARALQHERGKRIPFFALSRDKQKQLQAIGKKLIQKAASAKRCYLCIQGRSGAGKTLLAQAMAEEILAASGDEMATVNHVDLASITSEEGMTRIFGVKSGTFTEIDEKEGLLDRPGVLVCNQLEKVSETVARSWLDVVEDSVFRPIGSTGPEDIRVVRPVIIFTTNIDITACENLPGDLVNRLIGFTLKLPNIEELPETARRREMEAIVLKMCQINSITLEPAAHELLVVGTDWSGGGTLRSLRHVLAKAKDATLQSYPQALTQELMRQARDVDSIICHVTESTIQDAKKALGIGHRAKSIEQADKGRSPSEKIFWLVAVFLAEGQLGTTYTRLRGQLPQFRGKNIKRSGMKRWLEPLPKYLPAGSTGDKDSFTQALIARMRLNEIKERLGATRADLVGCCRGLCRDNILTADAHDEGEAAWVEYLHTRVFREQDANRNEVDKEEFTERLRALGRSLHALSADDMEARCAMLWENFFKPPSA